MIILWAINALAIMGLFLWVRRCSSQTSGEQKQDFIKLSAKVATLNAELSRQGAEIEQLKAQTIPSAAAFNAMHLRGE